MALLCWGPKELPKAGQESLIGQLQSIASDLCSSLDVNIQFDTEQDGLAERHAFAHPRQALALNFARQEVGVIARVHPSIVSSLMVDDSDAAVLLFDIDRLVEAQAKTKFKFKAPPKFPAIKVDVALALPPEVNYAAASKTVAKAAGKYLDSIELFDTYSGPGLEEGQHSMAFRVTLRDAERTLSDKEEQKFIKAVARASEQLGGNLRS